MKKIDPYAVLGVEKTADKKGIRRAYRKRAKQAHPDSGGSSEKFGALNLAHDILMDDKRREKYDVTGDIEETTPNNANSAAVNIIAIAFTAVLQECAQRGQSPLEIDVAQAVKQELKNMFAEHHKQLRILRTMLEMDTKLSGRFKTPEPDNIFEHIINNRLRSLRLGIFSAEDAASATEQGLKMIEQVKFAKDEATPSPQGIRMYFTTATASTPGSFGSW